MSIRMKIVAIVVAIVAFASIAPNVSAFDLFGKSCSGNASSSAACKQTSQPNSTDPVAGPDGIINRAANIIAVITGIAAVIMIILGGFTYVTSSGNAEKAAQGRRQVLYAVIAVAVVALAWTITSFIMSLIG